MKFQLICIALAIVFLSGCATLDSVSINDLEDDSPAFVASFYHMSKKSGTPERLKELEQLLAEKGLTAKEIEHARKGSVFIGMSIAGVYAALGQPHEENRTVVSGITSIQHIYPPYRLGSGVKTFYVYTRNGVVTAWQD